MNKARINAWFKSNTDSAAIGSLLLLMLGIAFLFKGWHQPLVIDRTFHIYSAQEIARGAVPYVDFFNIHPPAGIMLIALPMWLFPGLREGAGPAAVHSLLTVTWSAIGVVAIYFIAKRLSAKWISGFLAGFIWICLTPLFLRHFSVGQNRMLVTTALLLMAAFLQKERWYSAGFALSIGFMTYYPTILGGAAAAVLLLGPPNRQRFKDLLRFSAGFSTVVGLISLWLISRGAFIPWIKVTLLWPFSRATSGSFNQVSGGNLLADKAGKLVSVFQKGYEFQEISAAWVPLIGGIAIVHFLALALVSAEKRKTFLRDPTTSPVIVMTLMYLMFFWVESGKLDTLMLQSFLAIWVAWEINLILTSLKSFSAARYRIAVGLVLIVLGLYGIRLVKAYHKAFNAGLHPRFGSIQLEIERSVFTQVKAGEDFLKAYSPDNQIIVLGDMWLNNVTNRENPSRFYHTGEKMQLSAQLAGYATEEDNIYRQLVDLQPDMYLISQYRPGADYQNLTDLLVEKGYICAGEAGDIFAVIHPGDMDALVGSFTLQRAFHPDEQPDPNWADSILDLEAIYGLETINVREVAPGILLLKEEINDADGSALILYWWSWVDESDQADIILEISNSDGTITNQVLNLDRFSEDTLIRQTIPLDDLVPLPIGTEFRLISSGEDPRKLPCKSDFTIRDSILDIHP